MCASTISNVRRGNCSMDVLEVVSLKPTKSTYKWLLGTHPFLQQTLQSVQPRVICKNYASGSLVRCYLLIVENRPQMRFAVFVLTLLAAAGLGCPVDQKGCLKARQLQGQVPSLNGVGQLGQVLPFGAASQAQLDVAKILVDVAATLRNIAQAVAGTHSSLRRVSSNKSSASPAAGQLAPMRASDNPSAASHSGPARGGSNLKSSAVAAQSASAAVSSSNPEASA